MNVSSVKQTVMSVLSLRGKWGAPVGLALN